MKMIFISCVLLILLSCEVQSQPVIIKGKIRCLNQSENSTKGAENVVVIPAFKPSKETVTASTPPGYFELNTCEPRQRQQFSQSIREYLERSFKARISKAQNRYMTLMGDLFPSNTVATVVGLSGTAGGLGGFLSSLAIGRIIEAASFAPVFIACGLLYPAGLAIILSTVRRTASENNLQR